MPQLRLLRARRFAAALLLLSPLSFAQSAQENFFKAYYLHHKAGNLEAAAPLYKAALGQLKSGNPLAVEARQALEQIHEDLFAADFARLMPPETFVYVELTNPGQQLRALSEQLGLLCQGDRAGGMGLSPRLFDSALDVRGAALAITEIDPGGGPPQGVLVLHPGDQDSLRGLLETAIGNGGQPVDAIGGARTWSINGEFFVTQTRRLVIASPERALIEGVLQRLHGQRQDSFADAESLQHAQRAGSDDLLFFHLRAEPMLPQLRHVLRQQAQHNPDLAMAMVFIDIKSLVGVSGRLGVNDNGLGLKLGLELKEGHKNLAFNLLRLPAIKSSTLEHVPTGTAFLLAGALNERADVAPASGSEGRPIVTALDFGREFFANVVDVCIYGLPGENAGPIPDVALSLRVNNVERSRALWQFVLGLASQSSGAQSMEPSPETVAGVEVERYSLQGVPVYVYAGQHELLITPSQGVLQRTLAAREAGQSVLSDGLMGPALKQLGKGTNLALIASPARLFKMARPHLGGQERERAKMVAGLMHETLLSLGVRQTNTELGVTLEVSHLPDVSPLLTQLRAQGLSRGPARLAQHTPSAKRAAPVRPEPVAALRQERRAKAQAGRAKAITKHAKALAKRARARHQHAKPLSGDPRKLFETAVGSGRHSTALRALQSLAKKLDTNAAELNDLAWALLTEDTYGGKFHEQARALAERSNKLSEYGNWMYLDTLALAEFSNGNFKRAVEFETKALDLVQGTGGEAGVKAALKRFKAAGAERAVSAQAR